VGLPASKQGEAGPQVWKHTSSSIS
jgi:hypothetical protein